MRAFKIHSIQSDGSEAEAEIVYHVVDPQTGKPFKDEHGKPSVTIWLRPISKTKHRAVVQRHTEKVLNPKTRGMDEVTDWEAVQDDLVDFSVQRWVGLVGADDKPLQCVREAKVQLPGELANELVRTASVGQGVDAEQASL